MSSLSRRSLLLSSAALAGLPALATTARPGKRLVVVFAKGGWDTSYVLDPKRHVVGVEGPEVDTTGDPRDVELVRHYGDIAIGVNDLKRPAVSNFFERYAERLAIVRGLYVGSIGHDLSRTRLLTGTDSTARPDLTVIAGHEQGAWAPVGCVDLSNLQFVGDYAASTLRLGTRGQIESLAATHGFYPAPESLGITYPLHAPDPADQDLVRAHLEGRIRRMQGTLGDPGAVAALDGHLESLDRAHRFREAAGDLPLTSGSTIMEKASMAVELLSRGLCHTVLMDDESDWDTHYDTKSQHNLNEGLFRGLSSLAVGLESAGLLDETLVLVVSEMTRSPLRNDFGGKDHWPHTSIFMFGGGVQGGRIVGGTNDRLESLPVDLESGDLWTDGAIPKYDNLLAGVLEHLDIDPGRWLPGVAPYRCLHG